MVCLSDLSESTLEQFWDLESIGVQSAQNLDSGDEILKNFNESIKFEDGKYHVQLPWKENASELNLLDNRMMAETRLKNLMRKLAKDPPLKAGYNQAFLDMDSMGIIEEVPESELVTPHSVFYLPHHPVMKESSLTTRVRPVFDASAEGINGISLNNCLKPGPCLLGNLVGILIRFQRWKVGISKAFLQVGVLGKDQDLHRFLWNYGGSVRVMRFRRVPFGNTCSSFLLIATIKYHLSQYPESKAVEELRENTYVDDFISGADFSTSSQSSEVKAHVVDNSDVSTLLKE
ncbi:uncharacterized protein LOC135494296 [Lineus longissimus]|uniref:uncharacterized protein LOC135494296 n=1 Tax=Lineus longissimus TaxID=88925 RepID=UPI00315C898A